ncbi:MAG: sigma-70 family RNA polymerase sigma factor [Planctomycetes bacterium]|nr:sigma-70 family RNA polymerase sigma factor [Planctomycetota bacterium]
MQAMSPSSELEHLWRESSARLRAWFERHANAADAEDLVQETFIRVHARLDTLLDAVSVRAWIGTIARNVLVDHRRRRATRGADVAVLDEPPQPEPDEENLDRTVAGWLEDHLRELEPADAEALRVVDLEGRTHKDLAERAGLSLSGAKSRVQRARSKLRQRLEDCCAFAFDARGGILSAEKRRRECCEDEGCG